MTWRKWEPWQLIVLFLPYFVAFYVTSLPYHIGDIARILFPGWFMTYTPSALLTTLFVFTDDGIYKFWDGRPLFLYNYDDCYLIILMMEIILLIIGVTTVLSNALALINNGEIVLAISVSGNLTGLVTGFLASRDRQQ